MREASKKPEEQSKIYEKRRDEVCRGLDKLGWTYQKPLASMFVWARVSDAHLKGQSTIDFCLMARGCSIAAGTSTCCWLACSMWG